MNEQENNTGLPQLVDTSDVEPTVVPSNPDMSQGYVDPVQAAAPMPVTVPTAPLETLTPREGENVPPTEDRPVEPTVERLKQMNSQNSKLLIALGVDPMSDIAEQLEQGLITPEMLKNHVASKYQPAQTPNPTVNQVQANPVSQAEQALTNAETAYNQEISETGGVSLETNNALRMADKALNQAKLDALTYQVTAEKQSHQVNENVEAVLSIARSTPEYAAMKQPLQQTTDQISLALTGMLADQKAKEMGIDPSTLNAQQYAYFGGLANTQLESVANHYREIGRAEAKAGFVPAAPNPGNQFINNNQIPVPINNGGVPIPAVNPYAKVNGQNHADAAKAFMAQGRPIV